MLPPPLFLLRASRRTRHQLDRHDAWGVLCGMIVMFAMAGFIAACAPSTQPITLVLAFTAAFIMSRWHVPRWFLPDAASQKPWSLLKKSPAI